MLRGPYGLIGSIREAWARVRKELGAGELEKRLARRGLVSFRRPPRGWCLVVRASDTRINAGTAVIVPERVADARDPGEHEVVLDYKLVRRLCAPVSIEPPGEALRVVAGKLGTSRANLHIARFRGVLRSNYKRFAGGGSPVPMLYTDKTLDPNGPLLGDDSVWNLASEFLPDLLADGFEQRVSRVPRFMAPARL